MVLEMVLQTNIAVECEKCPHRDKHRVLEEDPRDSPNQWRKIGKRPSEKVTCEILRTCRNWARMHTSNSIPDNGLLRPARQFGGQ